MFDHRSKSNCVATLLLGAFLLAVVPRSAQAVLAPTGIGVEDATQHHAYVISKPTQSNTRWTVQEVPLTRGGRMRVLGGPLTGFCNHGIATYLSLTSVAISPSGSAYVSGYFGPKCEPGIEAFAPGASGNVRPILRIAGNRTRIGSPLSIAFDRYGRLYVSQGEFAYPFSRQGQVDVFAANAHGNVAPIAVLMGPKTQILNHRPVWVAVDEKGAIFVAQVTNSFNEVLKFAPGSSGNVAPLTSTALYDGFFLDEIQAVGDTVYASLFDSYGAATVYKLRASDLSIADEIMNPAAFLYIHAAADREGRVYVQNLPYPLTLFVYPPNSNTPKRSIADDIGGSGCCGGYVVIGP